MKTMALIPSYIIGSERVDLAATAANRMVETKPEVMELLLMRTSMLPYLAIFLTMLVMLLTMILSKARKKARRVRYPHSDLIIEESVGRLEKEGYVELERAEDATIVKLKKATERRKRRKGPILIPYYLTTF